MSAGHVARAGREQRLEWIAGSIHHVILDSAATGGRLTVLRSTMRAGAAAPVHVHVHEDETVFMLSGSGVFWAGDQRWELSSGDAVFLPRGLPHTYVFTSDEAELLTICNPAGVEELFRAAGRDLAEPRPQDWAVDFKALAEAGTAAGQIVLGPPLHPGEHMPVEYLNRP